ncbi:MdtA/MuxA family multidrug efflux RND transporter periplasmic adaptor subunit [Advenella mimigardefordensis]|uniref:Multidrug resistance protein MdtA n=1 Tax=Advenella mimigardefordensis (strain DSM 17166 / LMG 22922 / DPN7) TaxID=1247726 RepID=W0PC05_ADVMD|nr:MdtA/MuxA family multidrug efflux RND transporter periplasmic adaptor subunit [Advenella mimigardefordensis]AHG63022.1 multidrug resistance protein MdtA [Advenella mimigardefordensis DPN7]
MPAPSSTNRKSRKPLLLLIILLLAGGGYYYWQHSADQKQADKPAAGQRAGGAAPASGGRGAPGGGRNGMPMVATPVSVVPVMKKNLTVSVSGLGTVTAFNTVTVRSRVDGPIQKILFTEGQKVNEGDLLVQIDPRSFEVALQQAQGTLAQNTALLANAKRDLQRYQTLFKQDSIARQQVDTQQSLVRQYEGQAQNNQAAVNEARLSLTYTKVTAPISGRLGLRTVDVGNLVSAGSTDGIVTITQVQPIAVVFSMPESWLPDVAGPLYKGEKLKVVLRDRDNKTQLAEGELASMDNAVDTTTGTVRMKATFANENETLFPNQFVNTELKVREVPDALVVMSDAIQNSSRGPYVYIVKDDNTVETRQIELGVVDSGYTQITKGLAEGEQVVSEGVDRLRNGAKVEIVK